MARAKVALPLAFWLSLLLASSVMTELYIILVTPPPSTPYLPLRGGINKITHGDTSRRFSARGMLSPPEGDGAPKDA
jgi:hypothetical protein